jgi:hypothetical protein
MAAVEDPAEFVVIVELQGEAPGRDTIGGLQSWLEEDAAAIIILQEAQEGRVAAVVAAEAADEVGVSDEAAPARADEGGTGKGGGLRRKTEEDLGEQVVIFQRRRRRRRRQAWEAAEAGHVGTCWVELNEPLTVVEIDVGSPQGLN